MKRYILQGAVLAIATLAFAANHALADIELFTTQSDFTGWSSGTWDGGTNGNPQAPVFTVSPGASGDTDGSTTNGLGNTGGAAVAGALSLAPLAYPGGGQFNAFGYYFSQGEQASLAFLQALSLGTDQGYKLAVDYTIPQEATGTYFQPILVLNYQGHFDQIFNGAGGNSPGAHTSVIDYSAAVPAFSNAYSYFQLGFAANSDTTTPFAIDNIRLVGNPVPEPNSLWLASFGIIGIIGILRGRGAMKLQPAAASSSRVSPIADSPWRRLGPGAARR